MFCLLHHLPRLPETGLFPLRAASFGVEYHPASLETDSESPLLSTAQPQVAVSLKPKKQAARRAAFVDKAGKARYDLVSFN